MVKNTSLKLFGKNPSEEDIEQQRIEASIEYLKSKGLVVMTEAEKRQLEDAAIKDPLTGLYNRLIFNQALNQNFELSRRNKKPCALVLVDIDYFKAINDSYGHLGGDYILKDIAHVMENSKRRSDIATRIGGEEFALILPDTNNNGAVKVAEKVREEIQLSHPVYDGKTIIYTASFGVTELNDNDNTPQSLVSRADKLLYISKELGRNRVTSDRLEYGLESKVNIPS